MIENKQIIKKESLFNKFNHKQNQIINNQKNSSFKNLTVTTNLEKPPPHINKSVFDFIKQKNKFFIENSFDVKGTREFLASKEVAMRSIKLNDEIIEEVKEQRNKNYTNKNLLKINFMEECDSPTKNKRRISKDPGKRTISPRKSRKSHNLKSNKEIYNKDILLDKKLIKLKKMKKSSQNKFKDKRNDSYNKSNSSDLSSDYKKSKPKKEKDIIFDKESDSNNSKIYKFFIENANETEENFQNKLKKEIEKMNNKAQEKENKKNSLNKKDMKCKKAKRMNSLSPKKRNTQNIFMFSQINKKLMANEDINLSSIGEENMNLSPTNKPNKNKVKKTYGSIQMNNNKIKERIKEKIIKDFEEEEEKKNESIKMEVNSDKESIISILSDLL